MANKIIKTTLHPDLSPQDTDLYPKTSVDMIEGLTEEVTQLVTESTPAIVDEYIDNNIDKLKGEDGVGIQSITNGTPYVAGNNTITPVTVVTTDGNTHPLSVTASNGSKGTDGNGIVTAHSLKHVVEGDETITTVELVTDDGTNPQIEIHAQNGSGGAGTKKLYNYFIKLSGQCLLDNTDTGGISSYLIMNIVTNFNTDITTKNMSTIATILLNALHYSEEAGAMSSYYPANGIFTVGSTPPQHEGDVLAVFMRADDTSIIHFAYKNTSGISLLNGSLNMNLNNNFIKIEKIEL